MSAAKTKIEQLDAKSVRTIRTAIETALESVTDELGIKFRWLGTSYFRTHGMAKIEIATTDKNGNAMTGEVQDFLRLSHTFGVPNGYQGKTFRDRSDTLYRLIGLSPRKRKYPFIAIRVKDGRRFKFSADSIKQYLKIKGK